MRSTPRWATMPLRFTSFLPLLTITARSTFGIECTRTGTFLVDRCLPNSYLGQLLSYNMGRIPYRYLTSQIPRHLFLLFMLGQLFLGYFSGPVEGIIMIIMIFIVSGFHGLLLAHFFLMLPYFFIYRSFVLGPGLVEIHTPRSYTFPP